MVQLGCIEGFELGRGEHIQCGVWPNQFESFAQALSAIMAWRHDYNTECAHTSQASETPPRREPKRPTRYSSLDLTPAG